MDNSLPVRKNVRLKHYDYSSNGAYFITICVEDMRRLLCHIVGRDDLGAPQVNLSKYGAIAQKYIEQIELHYQGVFIDSYVIMPNHIHLLIRVDRNNLPPLNNGAPRSSRPTMLIPRIMAAFKKFANKEFGFEMWQTSYHEHIIRNENDYLRHWQYIEGNPAKWADDEYYTDEWECST